MHKQRTMGRLLEQLKSYFEKTPAEVLKKEYAGWSYLNEIGPDVLEYAKMARGYIIGTEMVCSERKYDLTISTEDIFSNAQYGMAA